jgi:hypothetical protein
MVAQQAISNALKVRSLVLPGVQDLSNQVSHMAPTWGLKRAMPRNY